MVYDYVENINSGEYENVAELFTKDYSDMLKKFLSNDTNRKDYIGIFNICSMEINSIQYVDNIEDYGNDLCIEDYREFDDVNIYLLNTNIDAFAESDYYNTGVNNILFVTGIENGSYKIIQTIILSNEDDLSNNAGIMSLDCDTPVSTTDSTWKKPMYINVYRTDLGVTQGVDFLYYCKVVTVCEVEEYAGQPEAVKAVAMAIKNYAWKSIMAECFHNQEQEI